MHTDTHTNERNFSTISSTHFACKLIGINYFASAHFDLLWFATSACIAFAVAVAVAVYITIHRFHLFFHVSIIFALDILIRCSVKSIKREPAHPFLLDENYGRINLIHIIIIRDIRGVYVLEHTYTRVIESDRNECCSACTDVWLGLDALNESKLKMWYAIYSFIRSLRSFIQSFIPLAYGIIPVERRNIDRSPTTVMASGIFQDLLKKKMISKTSREATTIKIAPHCDKRAHKHKQWNRWRVHCSCFYLIKQFTQIFGNGFSPPYFSNGNLSTFISMLMLVLVLALWWLWSLFHGSEFHCWLSSQFAYLMQI